MTDSFERRRGGENHTQKRRAKWARGGKARPAGKRPAGDPDQAGPARSIIQGDGAPQRTLRAARPWARHGAARSMTGGRSGRED